MNMKKCEDYAKHFELQRPLPPQSHCRLVFLYGDPGTGKTSLALDFARHVAQGDGLAFYLKPHSKWWDGYFGQKVVIMDEAEPRGWKELESLLKIWADRFSFVAEVKGATRQICPEWFVVTSNYTLEQLTDAVNNPKYFNAMMRRTGDGARIFSMETLGEYRPKSLWDFLKLNERKACEDVFDAFVKLVLGNFHLCSLTRSSFGTVVLHGWNAYQSCISALHPEMHRNTLKRAPLRVRRAREKE